jgi:hypothetical protein
MEGKLNLVFPGNNLFNVFSIGLGNLCIAQEVLIGWCLKPTLALF